MNADDVRVLSIQSHVVHGYVGNRSVVFPLQLLGFEVDFINSVQFSNHTWYKDFKGYVLNAEELLTLYTGLTANQVDNYSYILTGYVSDVSFLEQLSLIIKDQKERTPELVYVCDPVMGDVGKMYVPEALLPVFKEKIIPLADVLLPNQFEAEIITGLKIKDEKDALVVLDQLHGMGVQLVVLSSTELGGESELIGYASLRRKDGQHQRVRLAIPKIDVHFVGTGDLFSALVIAWLHRYPNDLTMVFKKVIGTIQRVLHRTYERGLRKVPPGQKPLPSHVELCLVQSKADIEDPPLHEGVTIFDK